jgi:hypothetical protein
MGPMSRRKLLHKGAQTVVAGSVAVSGIATLEPRAFSQSAPQAVDYYQKLGVTSFINAAGTYTVLSAYTMPDEVQAASRWRRAIPSTSTSCWMRQGHIWPSDYAVRQLL